MAIKWHRINGKYLHEGKWGKSNDSTLRAKIPGGWLVRDTRDRGITFVPDPQHAWDGNSLDDQD